MLESRWTALLAPALGLLLLAACSSDDGDAPPECVQTFCTAGEKACFGNSVGTCASDGRSYTLASCGSDTMCTAGECTPRACDYPGQVRCKDGQTLNQCSNDGMTLEEEACPSDTQCRAGKCLPIECEANAVECGFREFTTCNASGNGWTPVTACAATEICQGGVCIPQTCVPESRRCESADMSQLCSLDGTTWEDQGCAAGEVCDSATGTCLAKLCEAVVDTPDEGGMTGDTGGTDGTDGDSDVTEPKDSSNPLQPKDQGEVTINGENIEFSITVSATYVVANKELRIAMNKGQSKVEIAIEPIEEFDIGLFKSTEQSDTNVTIYYHDGSPLVGMAQFRYTSVDYELELIKFEAKDGRVKGTFSGTFTEDGGATTIPFTNGSFDMRRHN